MIQKFQIPKPKCQENLKLQASTSVMLAHSRFFIERFWVLLQL